ncbi:MAG: glycosyltransferase family 9 protein [Pseudomonadota bacterium]|nr:glycosyltransferase family 9 protein [Pseudomonadota bacterium]
MSARPRRVLVVCTRRIGDVLLTTPLIRSLRLAWPQARLEALVLPGTEGILQGNPDLDAVMVTPRGGWRVRLAFLRRLFRSYDLACAATGSDRARLLARWAGRRCIGLWSRNDPAWGRQLLPGTWLDFDELDEHAIESPLRIAAALGIEPRREVVPPAPRSSPDLPELRQPYAVIHPWPKFRYKAWPRERWLALGRALQDDGLQVVVSGGPDAQERAFCSELCSALPGSVDLAGRLGFAELAEVIARAHVYIGPDTVMTHLAAAVGAPTVALFGPSNPVRWGPWPAGLQEAGSPWPRRGSGRSGRVWLMQGPGDCVPCLLEGCDRHVDSRSRCLEELSVSQVAAAVAQAMLLKD